jgi:hypothetical protein
MASAVFVMGAGPLALDNRFGRLTSDDATSVVPGD